MGTGRALLNPIRSTGVLEEQEGVPGNVFCDPSFSQPRLRAASQTPPSLGRGCTPRGPTPLSHQEAGRGWETCWGLQAGGGRPSLSIGQPWGRVSGKRRLFAPTSPPNDSVRSPLSQDFVPRAPAPAPC